MHKFLQRSAVEAPRGVKRMEDSEARERVAEDNEQETRAVEAEKQLRKKAKSAPTPPPSQPVRPAEQTVAPPEFTPAERAMIRKQKEETHLYGRQSAGLLQWLLLHKLLGQSEATTVLSESSADLARENKH